MYFTEQDYFDSLGRCERMGELTPESELVTIYCDNDVELKLCRSCADEVEETDASRRGATV